jgi:hypothetical protein
MISDIVTDLSARGAHQLIRRVDGCELPASGCWVVPASHASVTFSLPRGLRHAETWQGRVTEATIVVGEHSDDVSISMRVDAPGLPAVTGSSRGSIARPTRLDPMASTYSWALFGQLTINGSTVPVQAILDYHGVWRRGDAAHGWFALSGVIVDGARAKRRMRFAFELLADQPFADRVTELAA